MTEPADDLMTSSEVASRLKINRRTLSRWVADGRFPTPIRLSRKTLRWRRSDVETYCSTIFTS